MKKQLLVLGLLFQTVCVNAQNPGLVISELLANPPGTDNAFEWVELVATKSIDFSVTPYSVVVNNNGTATANGWVNGGTVTYGFSITSGTVTAGDVVYVGGSTMLPTGTKLRTINVVSTAGDGFGNAAAGVFGNGGSNADGIAVFNVPIGSITASTVPVDAIFYGTGIGTALVNAGADGYQLPVNDRYNGGKLQTSSFLGADPASDNTLRATGTYNTATDLWSIPRTWTTQATVNDNATAITLSAVTPPGTASVSGVSQIVSEAAGTATVNVTFANANSNPAKIAFGLSTYTNATFGSDFSWTSDTLTIPANTNGTFPFTIQLTDDLLAERTERIIVKMIGSVNATPTGNTFQIIYLTDNDYQNPTPTNELKMSLLTSFSNGAEGTNSAEIVAYDSTNYRLFIANSIGAKLDIVDFSNPASPALVQSIAMAPYGNINSLTTYNGIVAVAVENSNPQANGSVVFFDGNTGAFINQVTVGAMPDMITYNNDHTKIVVACEGEPKTDYSVDPEGSVAIVDLTPGVASLTNANVAIASFTAWNGQEAALRAQGIRIFGPGSSAAQDFEPEYITISDDNQTAYVSLQENNAMAVVNLSTATVTEIRPLGLMDYSANNNGLDASDQTSAVLIGSIPVKGTFMPDALAHANIRGQEYIFSANEGDAREYTAVTDVARTSATNLDVTAFPDQTILKNNQFLGRLNALQATGDTDGDGDKDEIHVLGTRSFSIWNAATGALVFDSKDLIEQITATHPAISGLFNASNTSGAAVSKNRSDDKGPEPEGVATAIIDGTHYLFVSLERVGGVMIFNVDEPTAPVYVGYYNNRSAAANGPDRGAEGIIYISAEASPNNESIVILANEVSSTLSIFQVNTCAELAGAEISATEDTLCSGQVTTLSIPGNANSSIQWYRDNTVLPGETANTLNTIQAGQYKIFVSNTALSCSDTTVPTTITVNPLPNVAAGADQSVCTGTSVTLSGSGAQSYIWNNGISNGTSFTPASTLTYTVTGTDANGCQNTDQVVVTVKPLPLVSAGADQIVCSGNTTTLSGSGGVNYSWSGGITNGIAFTPSSTQTFTVTGTGTNGCQNTDQVTVTLAALPLVDGGADLAVCLGETVLLQGSGASNYSWTNATDGVAFTPTSTADYIVTGTDNNGCTAADTVHVTVHSLPLIDAGNDVQVCSGESVQLNASGAQNYQWSNNIPNGSDFIPTLTTLLNVSGTDANGCTATDQLAITVLPLPEVLAGLDVAVCSGESITLNGTGAQNYSWNNSIQNGVAFVPTTTQNYIVEGTAANGCSDTDTVHVTVHPLPVIDLGSDTTTCSNYGPVVLDAGSGFSSYNWNNNAHTQTTTANVTGTYSVTVSDANGCENSDAISVVFDPCLGVDETSLSIVLFPNPTESIVTISTTPAQAVRTNVYSLSGQQLFTVEGNQIDLQNLATGTYLLQVQAGQTTRLFRVEKTQ